MKLDILIYKDEEAVYLSDSLKFIINCDEKYYNRKLSIADFKILLNTWIPFYKNSYIVVRDKGLPSQT